jgi:hypothetical protein
MEPQESKKPEEKRVERLADGSIVEVQLSRAFVTRQFKTADKVKTEENEEVLEVHRFVTEPAKVGLEYGITLNLGGYESARVSVLVQMPCYREEVDAAYDHAKQWAEKRIKSEIDEIRGKSTKNPF